MTRSTVIRWTISYLRNIDYGLLRLSDLNYCLIVGVSGQHGILTPPGHLIQPLVYPEVRVCHALDFEFFLLFRITRYITVRYLCPFIEFGYVAKLILPACIDTEFLDRRNGILGLSRAIPNCMLLSLRRLQ